MKPSLYVLLVFLACILCWCTEPENAKRVLASQGCKQITITGYELLGCAKNNLFHTGFQAIGVNGQHVSGVVCSSGVFKGSTVRIY